MPDRYQSFAHTGFGRRLLRSIGMPVPTPLRRHVPGEPDVTGTVRLSASGGRVTGLSEAITELGATVDTDARTRRPDGGYRALVLDATGITEVAGLRRLYDFFHPAVAALGRCGRVVVIGASVSDDADPTEASIQAGLTGFVRSLGKELRDGATANLIRTTATTVAPLRDTLRFFLSSRSAFVSGQTVQVDDIDGGAVDPAAPLHGRTALITGAARGIGAVTAEVLARQGASVVCVDLPSNDGALESVAARVGGEAIPLDITGDDAGATVAQRLRDDHGGVDIVVHNAGVTRDKSIVGMSESGWDTVMAVNLTAPHRLTAALVGSGTVRRSGRIVVLSSLMGIAGNMGQTNYATSKAGLIGWVRAAAPRLAAEGITINAVAPGFIETRMTDTMKPLVRQMGRRLSALAQGGQPVDVGETVAWLASPGSAGITGSVVRVCGQSLLGA